MASDLMSIARSGTRAARIALDVTAQNIANASSEGYVRRSVSLSEVVATGSIGGTGQPALSGVRLAGIVRNADPFRQAEVRRTGSDAARAGAEVAGLQNVESAVEQSGVYPAVVDFESALQRLVSNPVDPSLRAATIESADAMAQSFNLAARELGAAGDGMRFQAGAGVDEVNTLAAELARVNLRLSRASDASGDQSALLDQRDQLLSKLSDKADLATTINPANGTVEVRLGGTGGAVLVGVGTSQPLGMTTAADGTVSYTLGGGPVSVSGGALAGHAQALGTLATTRTRLDTLALSVRDTVNAAQTSGAALDGSAGQPLFTGTGAADLAIAFSSGAGLATAPAGAAAGSRDPANLDALRTALAGADPAGGLDSLLFDVSSAVAARSVTRDALDTIAGNARIALAAQAGVDLDQEAVNLIRYQQAFQASGRVIQCASDIFDTMLGIR